MSLINDALKQAKQSQQSTPPPTLPPLRPVEPPPRSGMGWLLPVIIVALITVAGFFIGMSVSGGKKIPTKPSETVKTPEPVEPVVAVPTEPAPAPEPVPTPVPAVVSVTNEPVITNAVEAAPKPPPEPKLQGIFYGAKPWAIVNGKTVYVGDYVKDLKVLEISKDSIMLENADGLMRKLTLGD